MDLIYARWGNDAFIEEMYLNECTIDAEVGDGTNNDTEIKIYDTSNLLEVGNYIIHEEIGGIIDGYTIDTLEQCVTYHVTNWFGMLDKVIVEPSEGNSHRIVDGEILASYIDDYFGGVIKLDPNNLTCPVFVKTRYDSVLWVFNQVNLDMNGTQAISFEYKNGCMNIVHGDVSTYNVVMNNDYGIRLVVQNQSNYNHLIALGSGELTERQVLHYFYTNGKVTTTDHQQTRRTYVYDYPNVESLEELHAKAKEKLKEVAEIKKVTVEIEDGDFNIGDSLRVQEKTMNFDSDIMITQKVYTGNIVNGVACIEVSYKVGD